MTSFGTFRTARRIPAGAGQPIVDPAGWEPEELVATNDWIYRLTPDDIVEVQAEVDTVLARNVAPKDFSRDVFPLPRFAAVLAETRRELQDGRGIVVLRGLPVAEMGRERAARAFLGIGAHLGTVVSQNAYGHLLGHVRDFGKSYDDPRFRGYHSNAALGFHCDHCDYVGLLCMQTSRSGGESRVASAVTLYNRMYAQQPDLVAVLERDFYFTRHGEVPAGKPQWYTQPVFSFHDGYFSARGVSAYIRKAQGLPGVPPFTPEQEDAMALYVATVENCAADIPFAVGDIQLLHNHIMLHSRRAFTDWPDPARRRHLYRLWLRDPAGRPLPDDVRENFSGIYVPGGRHQVVIDPERAEEAAA
ncbi:MAG: TauD/TfdA family dioxygenase [Alphaproteobacteria bacterium]